MRKICLMLAIAGMLALPGMSYANPFPPSDVCLSMYESGTTNTSMDYDPDLGAPLCIDVVMSTNTSGVWGVTYDIGAGPQGDPANAKWMTAENQINWTNGALFMHMPPYFSEYKSTIGDPGLDGANDVALTLLSLVPAPEGYIKDTGEVAPGTTGVVATYCIRPAEDMEYSETYVFSALYGVTGIAPRVTLNDGDDYDFDETCSDTLTVHIIPEPVSALFLLAGLPFLRRRR